jgi:hypothetical protein
MSFQERTMDEKQDVRSRDKRGGHQLPPKATENPMDDTDRNTDKVLEPGKQTPPVK